MTQQNPFILSIKNFQSLEDVKLELKGFCTLQGATDSGKSAVVRALRTVLFNEWDASYLRDGAKECQIVLTLPEHVSDMVEAVKVLKGKTKNEFVLKFRDGTEKSYPKIGRDTPNELKELGFNWVETERGEKFNLNIQPQLKPLFLLSESGVSLTSFLNTVFNVSRYERANKSVNADLNKLNQQGNSLRDQVSVKEAEVQSLAEEVKSLQQKETALSNQIQQVEGLQTQAEECVGLSTEYNNTWAHAHLEEQTVAQLQQEAELLEAYIKAFKEGERLLQLTAQARETQQQISEGEKQVTLYQDQQKSITQYAQSAKDLNEVQTQIEVYKEAQQHVKEGQANQVVLTGQNNVLTQYGQALEQYSNLKETGTRLYMADKQVKQEKHAADLLQEKIQPLSAIHTAIQQALPLRKQLAELDEAGFKINQCYEEGTQHQSAISNTQQKLQTLNQKTQEFYQTVKVCPTCKQSFPHCH